jgi:hypothetical protein
MILAIDMFKNIFLLHIKMLKQMTLVTYHYSTPWMRSVGPCIGQAQFFFNYEIPCL